jgi:hypothetical protein
MGSAAHLADASIKKGCKLSHYMQLALQSLPLFVVVFCPPPAMHVSSGFASKRQSQTAACCRTPATFCSSTMHEPWVAHELPPDRVSSSGSVPRNAQATADMSTLQAELQKQQQLVATLRKDLAAKVCWESRRTTASYVGHTVTVCRPCHSAGERPHQRGSGCRPLTHPRQWHLCVRRKRQLQLRWNAA